MRPDAKAKIDEVCRAWAEDTGEPFVTLVARRGVIVTHEAFGRDPSGQPITRDYRCWVASITKTVTALLFSQFVDQRLIAWDDPLSAVFPDYPKNDPHVPTFRQCFNHTSGLAGHGDFGGMRNPHLENIVLNGIDANEPNVKYAYSGLGFELAAKAMELVAGKSAVRVYDEHLFRPLGFGDVPIGNASSDGEFTALELGILAQWVANRGSYGQWEFITPQTFDQLLPQPLRVPDHGSVEDEGIGLHWIRHAKPGTPPNSKRPEDLLFSPRTVGHGSFSGCIFVVDPEQQLVITQVRKHSGPRSADWAPGSSRPLRQRWSRSLAEYIEGVNALDPIEELATVRSVSCSRGDGECARQSRARSPDGGQKALSSEYPPIRRIYFAVVAIRSAIQPSASPPSITPQPSELPRMAERVGRVLPESV